MSIIDWIPGITTTMLFAAALWLGRKLILTRLERSVSHEFNAQLEKIKSDFRQAESRLQADLRRKESDIAMLTSNVLGVSANRQAELHKRRLEAVDQLWTSVNSLASARTVSRVMSGINFEESAKASEHDPKIQDVFKNFGMGFDLKDFNSQEAQKAKPFVTPLVWATYSALITVCFANVIRWQIIKDGLGQQDFLNHSSIQKMIKEVLPEHAAIVDEYGPRCYDEVLNLIEGKLLSAIREMISGQGDDEKEIARAAEIVRLSTEVRSRFDTEHKASDGVAKITFPN